MTAALVPSAHIAQDPSVLRAVRDEDCNLAVWERPPLAGIAEHLPLGARDIRFTTRLATVSKDICAALKEAGYPSTPVWADMHQDIVDLAVRYCDILKIDSFEVRLEVVTTDACRKFHADYVSARLITTYCGQGTQWLDDHAAAQLAKGEEPQHIGMLGAGDVGLFKGKLATMHPAIHRSPPISGTGERRLLLVLNPAEE